MKGSALRAALAVALVIGLLMGSIAGSYALGLHALNESQHRWCATLNLLNSDAAPKPVHPAQNPSRERAYQFSQDLRQLARQFRCS